MFTKPLFTTTKSLLTAIMSPISISSAVCTDSFMRSIQLFVGSSPSDGDIVILRINMLEKTFNYCKKLPKRGGHHEHCAISSPNLLTDVVVFRKSLLLFGLFKSNLRNYHIMSPR